MSTHIHDRPSLFYSFLSSFHLPLPCFLSASLTLPALSGANTFTPVRQRLPSKSSTYSTIRTALRQNLLATPHTPPSVQQNTQNKVLKGTLFMETTKHFGEHFRKQHKNRKVLLITTLTTYLQIKTTVK